MMRAVTILILHAFVLPGLAKKQEVQKSADTSVDELTSKLVDRLLGSSALHNENMDDAIFAKTHPDVGAGLPAARAQPRFLVPGPSGVRNSALLSSLPGPAALKDRLISGIETTNRGCSARDVSMKAEQSAKEWIADWKATNSIGGAVSLSPASPEMVKAMPGITGPLGFFDPLGISANVPEGRLLFYREAELKHGRVCMLAILGLLVAEKHAFIPFLGEGIDADKAAYLLATPFVQTTNVAKFWPAALFALLFEEMRRARNVDYGFITLPTSVVPGDYGWDPLGLKPKDAKGLKELQDKELNNGRLAMFAAAGIIAQEQVTNSNILPR